MTEDFYSRLEELVHEGELYRRKIVRDFFFSAGIITLLFLLSIPFIVKHEGIFWFSLIAFFVLNGFLLVYHLNRWKKYFKSHILELIIKAFFPQATYEPGGHLPLEVFKGSMLFLNSPRVDRYKGEDYLEMDYKGVKIKVSEVHAEHKTEHTDSDGKSHTSWETVFKGLLIVSEFPKKAQGIVLLYPSLGAEFLGKIFKPRGFQKANMEDPEFERHFDVFTTDQIEARYVLSLSLMKRILEFKKKTGSDLRFSFMGNTMYCAMEFEKDFLKAPPLFSSLYPIIYQEKFKQYVEEIELVLSIVDELRLMDRLWV